jgi:alpha-L-fucosidase
MQITPRPDLGQLAWQAKELGMFCHFGINTFHNKEWSAGQLSPHTFNPTRFDAAQWVDVAQRAGMRYLILTAKHHDGFCLWPTATTGYSVANSPFCGDVVAEVARACAAAGMAFGIYLSPWDRNAASYPDAAAYDAFYQAQLTELCTGHGPLCEIWLDGAGSEGRVYNWDSIMAVIDRYQPGAMVFNMGRLTIRWIGNEDGLAQDPCYYAAQATAVSAFTGAHDRFTEARYLPPECDVAIRRNWFWQDDDAHTLKSQENLLGIYYRSIGYGANLLLNLGPNREGLLDERDSARLLETTAEIKRRLAQPRQATLRTVDNGYEADFGEEVNFDHLIVREELNNGQRIDGYRIVDAHIGRELCAGVTIVFQKWHVLPRVRARHIRVELDAACAPGAAISAITAYCTGYEKLPSVAAPIDYSEWAHKADGREIEVVKWRAAG